MPVTSNAATPLIRDSAFKALLPPWDGETLQLRNRAYATAPCSLRGGRTLVWQDTGAFIPSGQLRCRSGESSFLLAVDLLFVLEPRLHGVESYAPPQACMTLVEHALSPVLELFERLLGRSIVCDEFQRSSVVSPSSLRDEEERISVGFMLRSSQPVRGRLTASAALWRSFDFSRVPALPSARAHGLPLDLSVQLGQCRLPLTELNALSVGDALRVTPRLPRQTDGLPVQLQHGQGGFGCRARLKGHQLTLESPMKANPEATPSSSSAVPARPADEQILTSIECDLTFELGHLRMSLAEIAKLRVGQAVPMGKRLQDQPVRILVNGQAIGRGELASLGDEIVVVVTDTSGLPAV